MEQRIITPAENYRGLDQWLRDTGAKRVFLVCDGSIAFLPDINKKLAALEAAGLTLVRFSGFQPNPLYENVTEGVRQLRAARCDALMAVGGGSALDVAKCIKRFAPMEGDGAEGSFLKQASVPDSLPFLAMPTTAGTGSEATRFAVIYYEGKKQSVTDEGFIPGTVLMDPGALKTLPLYQKKATMLDALCHAIESWWSVNSTPESREYSRQAIRGIMTHMEGYLDNTEAGRAGMLTAANLAGKAINITQTTAGHAMCYKLTSLFGLAHGHAAALCDRVLYPWMVRHTDRCTDPRGETVLREALEGIARALGCDTPTRGAEKLDALVRQLELSVPAATEEQFAQLRQGVNPDRLRNHPIALDGETIDALYHEILQQRTEEP